jgi:ABC-type branched-subunit amino acid transport system permease subunit
MAALPEVLRFSEDWRMIIYGAVLLAAMLAMPGGVAGWLHGRRVARMRTVLQ